MSDTTDFAAAVEARMASGEPFTYGMLCAIPKPFGEGGRTADKLIQKWRRQGRIKIDGRIGRAPRWVLVQTNKTTEEGK